MPAPLIGEPLAGRASLLFAWAQWGARRRALSSLIAAAKLRPDKGCRASSRESKQRSPVVPDCRKLYSSSTAITGSPVAVLPLSLFATSPSGRRESFLPGELASVGETERLYHMPRFRSVSWFPESYPSYNLSVTYGDTSPCRRGLGIPQTIPLRRRESFLTGELSSRKLN